MSQPLASPVYTLTGGPSSWQGNVTDDWGVDWIVTEEDGWSSTPPIRATGEEKTGADGSYSGPGFYGARVVTLTGKAIAPDQRSMLLAKDRIKAALQPRAMMDLTVEELHMARTARVRLTSQLDLKDIGARGFDFTLILTAPDPRRYAATAVIANTGLPSAITSGRSYPRVYPMMFGGSTGDQSGSVFITQEGDFDETPARITFLGALYAPQVAHVESGRTLTFGVNLGENDVLEVDLGDRTATLNGMSARASTITSSSAWFLLQRGRNELQFRGHPGSDTATPLMIVSAASAWT